jgi:hypothetical protein
MKKLYSAMLFAIATTGLMAQTPIWSDDFSDPSTWTMGNLDGTTGSWVIGSTAPSGDFPIDPIASTTASNGFALYDSDLLCDEDNAYIQNATPIDLSGHPYVMLQFQEYYRNFQGETFVDVSNNGTDWTSTQINSALATNVATTNPLLISMPITATAGGQATVYIRFRYVGNCDYSWMVDDAVILPQPDNDLTVVGTATTAWDNITTVTYDSLPYTIYPISELRPLGLNMTLTNNGAAVASDVTTTITSTDGYSDTHNSGTLAQGDTITYYAPAYTPSPTVGSYTINYSAGSDSTDATPTDNTGTQTVQVSNFIYARDGGIVEGGYNDTDEGTAFKIGNIFHTIADETLYGIDVAFTSTSAVGVELNAQLLDPNESDFPPLYQTAYHTLTTGDLSTSGTTRFVSFIFDNPVQLTAGTDYLPVVQHFGGANVIVAAGGLSPDQTSFLQRSSIPAPDNWFYVTLAPIVRMNFDSHIGITENDINNGVGLGQNYPNPANNGSTRIDVSLQQSAHVNMVLRDISGKLVQTLEDRTMAPGLHHVDVNTANLGAGVYFYTLTTNNMTSTKRMTVVR